MRIVEHCAVRVPRPGRGTQLAQCTVDSSHLGPPLWTEPRSVIVAPEGSVGIFLGFVLGSVLTAALFAAARLLSGPTHVICPEREAMRAAVHSATATLPYLRTGLTHDSARRSIVHLRALTQASCVVFADESEVLAVAGDACQAFPIGAPLPAWLVPRRRDRLLVEPRLRARDPSLPFGSAVVVPLVVRESRVGNLIALYGNDQRLGPEDTRVVAETGALISAQLELAEMEVQNQRLAVAELRALRAQISPHFIHNALTAVAALIRTSPDDARELLAEFAQFLRYAFRGQRPYVTLADELHYIEKYLRLEQARFGKRLNVRISVAPEVLGAVVPALSVQPLVENAVRHGVEMTQEACRVEILGVDLNDDVELCVRDDGPGMCAEVARKALEGGSGGIGLVNVQRRLQSTFGPTYGLQVESRVDAGTTVRMTVPKFRAGIRVS
jgi:two-component system, LytTR family, sensor kinase